MSDEKITTGHITWDASAPLEVTPHPAFKFREPGEVALTVTVDGQFIWANNADELIERADGAMKHILIALREVRK